MAIAPAERTLGGPDGGGEWNGKLLKHRGAEEVGHECDRGRDAAPTRCVERNLVDILDQHVRPPVEMPAIVATRVDRKGVSRTDAKDLDVVEHRVGRTVWPSAAEKPDRVPLRGETAK